MITKPVAVGTWVVCLFVMAGCGGATGNWLDLGDAPGFDTQHPEGEEFPANPAPGDPPIPETYLAYGRIRTSGLDDTLLVTFTLASETDVILRFSSVGTADMLVFPPVMSDSFRAGLDLPGAPGFRSQVGYVRTTLQAGTWVAGVRSANPLLNRMAFEVDRELRQWPDATYVSTVLQQPSMLEPGERESHAFTVLADHRYHLDGNNSGIPVYVLTQSQAELFMAGAPFTPVAEYTQTDGDPRYPGRFELVLPPGNYAIAWENRTTQPQSANAILERWARGTAPTGNPKPTDSKLLRFGE